LAAATRWQIHTKQPTAAVACGQCALVEKPAAAHDYVGGRIRKFGRCRRAGQNVRLARLAPELDAERPVSIKYWMERHPDAIALKVILAMNGKVGGPLRRQSAGITGQQIILECAIADCA